jgi:hypothetical protein
MNVWLIVRSRLQILALLLMLFSVSSQLLRFNFLQKSTFDTIFAAGALLLIIMALIRVLSGDFRKQEGNTQDDNEM